MLGLFAYKLGIQGALSSIGTIIAFSSTARVVLPYLNREIPLWALSFGIGALSSIISDAVHVFVSKEIHLSKKAEDEVATLLSVGVSAVMFYQAMAFVNPEIAAAFGMSKAYLIGGISEYGSSLITNMWYHM